MRTIVFVIAILVLSSCKSQFIDNDSKSHIDTLSMYKVQKIVERSDYYVIHAEKNKSSYKILSYKIDKILTDYEVCDTIKENNNYILKIKKVIDNQKESKGVEGNASYLHIRCYGFKNSVKECPDSIFELYQTDSIIGKCYRKSKVKSMKFITY